MGKLFSVLFLSFSFYTYSQKTDFKIDLLKGKKAFDHVFNSKQVRLKSYTDVPNYIEFIEGKEPLETDIFKILNNTSKNALSFEFINSLNDELNMTHKRYKQTINGYPVEHSMIIVHTKAGKVVSVNGDASSSTPNTETSSISFDIALQIAKGHIGAVQYKWEDQNEEKFIKAEQKDPKATFYPKSELVYITKDADFSKELRLAYKLNIYAKEPLSRQELFIDAINGEVLFKNNLLHHVDVLGTASTAYSGSQSITTDSFGGGFRLRESGRGNGIETYDLNRSNTTGGAVDFTDTDNNWSNVNALFDEYATDAHFGAEKTYDYFMQVHNRNSIDGQGFALKNYVHYGTNYAGAFWDGARMTYGDGDTVISTNNPYKTKPYTSLDIVAHEITHGLIAETAGLYGSSGGALNESFCDIFAVSIDFWSRPNNANWLLGDEVIIGADYVRSMSNPKAKNNPDCYEGQYWNYGGADHSNNGVQNFWYYLLVNGGSGTNDNNDTYSVSGLGLTKAEKIAFRNLTVYLTPRSSYNGASFYGIQSAKDLYGNCSSEVESTTNAWYAVGLGKEYNQNTIVDFTTPVNNFCKTPFVVPFTNLSNKGNTYVWDFGDGNTSTAVHPTHTYTNYGSYTVKLRANSGGCGIDSVVKVSYINIDSTILCEYMHKDRSEILITECSGILYDDGGPNSNYINGYNSTVVIRPPGAGKIYLTIDYFDVEGGGIGTWCNKDHLSIFEGTTVYYNKLGRYCNTNPPPTNLTVNSGAVTLFFEPNHKITGSGYKITWSCTPQTVLPIAQFSNSSSRCLGDYIQVTNESSDFESQTWLFPGGYPSTSDRSVVSVDYDSVGLYPVTLIVTNGLGSDTITKYMQVDICSETFPDGGYQIKPRECYGTIFDDGGENGNYSVNQNGYIAIQTSGTSVTLDMEFFDVEAGGANCDYDYIEVMDGSVYAPVIGKYCNSNPPPATITSSTGNISIRFYSDNSVNLQGVKINWSCDHTPYIDTTTPPPAVTPAANFYVVSGRNQCVGSKIFFREVSLNNPTSFEWLFPGGNPATSYSDNTNGIIYNTPGLYDVHLKVSNTAGIDSVVGIGFIHVYDTIAFDYNYAINGLNVSYNVNSNFSSLSDTYWAWDFGDGTVSVNQNPNHIYAIPGTYEVCLKVGNRHCGSKTICKTITIDPPLGLGDINLIRSFKLFPNPTNSLLNVHVEFFKEEELSIKLVDVVGNLLIEQSFSKKSNRHQEVINMSALSKGSYILYVNNVAHKVTKD